MIFSVKDSLRQAVEAASGGLCTVMYTRKGQPVFLRRIPRFNLEDIDPSLGTGPHPAFVVGDRVVSEIWIGMYPGVISQGELVSVPGVAPTLTNYNAATQAARASGPGFHLVTRAEWTAAALLHWKANGGQEVMRGPTNWGRSHEAPWETGVRVDGRAPGEATGSALILTGSGPLTWRHDGSPCGISEMIYPPQITAGARLVNGEIQIIPDNNAALDDSTGWMAVSSTGALVPPGSPNTLKFDIPASATYTDDNVANVITSGIRLRTTRTAPPPGWDENSVNQDYINTPLANLALDTDITVPPLLRIYGIVPLSGFKGAYVIRPYGTRVLASGYTGSLGPTATEPSGSGTFGARPAFVL